MVGPVEINNKSGLLGRQKELEKKDRRKVKDGYPRNTTLTTAEVEDYLAQDLIDCLICGARKKSLGSHLAKVHHVSSDAYRESYGLPYRRGLTSTSTHAKLAAVREKDSSAVILTRTAQLTPMTKGGSMRQRTSRYKTLCALRNASYALPRPRVYGRGDAEKVMRALEGGAMVYPYLRAAGGMCVSTFMKIIREYPDLDERYQAIAGGARRIAMQGNKCAVGIPLGRRRK